MVLQGDSSLYPDCHLLGAGKVSWREDMEINVCVLRPSCLTEIPFSYFQYFSKTLSEIVGCPS